MSDGFSTDVEFELEWNNLNSFYDYKDSSREVSKDEEIYYDVQDKEFSLNWDLSLDYGSYWFRPTVKVNTSSVVLNMEVDASTEGKEDTYHTLLKIKITESKVDYSDKVMLGDTITVNMAKISLKGSSLAYDSDGNYTVEGTLEVTLCNC